MTHIHRLLLCAVVIVMMLTAGCTFPTTSGAPALVTPAETTVAPVSSTPVAGVTTLPVTAGTQASGTCTADLNNDAANCGGCGYACPANALCQQGQCFCKEGYAVENNACVVAPSVTGSGNGCPAGMSPCSDGYCYELTSSASNCGICGNQCPAGMICSASTCSNLPVETTAAPVTTTAAVTTTASGTTTATPITTITGLGLTKPGGYTLSCVVLGLTSCSGSCVNLTTNNGNCGSCGHVCSGLTATCCGGGCTSLKTDESNCGTCGHKCGITSTCESGSCKVKAVVTGKVLVTPKISLKVTVPQYKQPEVVLPGNI